MLMQFLAFLFERDVTKWYTFSVFDYLMLVYALCSGGVEKAALWGVIFLFFNFIMWFFVYRNRNKRD